MVDNGDDEAAFVPGQLFGGTAPEDLTFIGGQMGHDDEKSIFVPGQTMHNSFVTGQMVDFGNNNIIFMPGDLILNEGAKARFVPGKYDASERGISRFVPGITLETPDGQVFIEGRLHRVKNEAIFVPGHIRQDGHFERAVAPQDMKSKLSPEPAPCLDGNSLSLIFQKERPKNGVMVTTKNGSKFYPEGQLPDDLAGATVTPGRMEFTDNGPTFVPGQSMNLNGIKSFIPGKFQENPDGTKTFIPGKLIHTKNGKKFVCGQVIQTEEGEKFLPGIVLNRPEGKIFVPAMEIQTKSGPVLIPGQVSFKVFYLCCELVMRCNL